MNQYPANGHHDASNKAAPSDSSSAAGTYWVRWPWLPYVLPLAVFMLAGMFEPTPDKPASMLGLTIEYDAYPVVYTIKLALVIAALAVAWPAYRQFSLRLTVWGAVVGVVGIVIWVGLCTLGLERTVLEPLGLADTILGTGTRSGFNPLAELADRPAWAYGFLAIRLVGLALVVPVMEEFFLRGFVMRFVQDAEWWKVPFGVLTPMAIAVGTLLPVLTHPAEMLAAAVWFSLVTWLEYKTKTIWDCVLAHAVTNLLLGVWVISSGQWHLM